MDDFRLAETNRTPAIEGSVSKGNIAIMGKCYPENSQEFFANFLKWLQDFYEHCPNDVQLRLHLDYYNTAAVVLLAELLRTMQRLSNSKNVRVLWVYEEDDFDMKETGQDYISVFGNFIELEAIPQYDA